MKKYIIKRLIYIFIVFMILSFLMYLIYNMVPFDRAKFLAEEQKALYKTDPEGFAALEQSFRVKLGLVDADGNKVNVFFRWLQWLGLKQYNGKFNGVLQGYFGVSYSNNKIPVLDVLREPMKNTIFINIFATIIALGITIPLGIKCAVKKETRFDTGVQVFSIIGYSMPSFITAILFIFLFAVIIPIFPVSGQGTPGNSFVGLRSLIDKLYYMCLPLIVMTFTSLGGMTRYVRASMIEALSMDCIKTARSKGLKEKVVVYSHAWRNALIPVVSLVVGWFLGIFSGSVMIENIFGLNGMGKLYIVALNTNDYDVVLTLQMFYVFIGLLGNLIIDILYGLVDPRIRVQE